MPCSSVLLEIVFFMNYKVYRPVVYYVTHKMTVHFVWHMSTNYIYIYIYIDIDIYVYSYIYIYKLRV